VNRNRTLGWTAAGLIVVIAAFATGRALYPTAESSFAYETDAPAYEPAASVEGRSRAGFAGVGVSGAIDGQIVFAGRVVDIKSNALTLESVDGVPSVIGISAASPVRVIEAATTAALRPGASVLVQRDGDDAVAVLVVLDQ
jgi:hypothetical protein